MAGEGWPSMSYFYIVGVSPSPGMYGVGDL